VVSDAYVDRPGDDHIIARCDMPWVARVKSQLAARVEVASGADLAAEIRKMADFLESKLGGRAYDVSGLDRRRLSCFKSNDWMAALLYDAMATKPRCVVHSAAESAPVYVMADDCSYSGSQLAASLKKEVAATSGARECFVLVPYMTRRAWRRLTGDSGNAGAPVTRAYGSTKCTFWKPVFVPETRVELEAVLGTYPAVSRARKDAVRRSMADTEVDPRGVALFFLEHKIPDFLSFPCEFVVGIVKTMEDHGFDDVSDYSTKQVYKKRGARVPRPLACQSH